MYRIRVIDWRWLFYAYDRIRKLVFVHVLSLRNALTLQQLLALLSSFTIAFYMTDAWPIYQNLLPSASHCSSKMLPGGQSGIISMCELILNDWLAGLPVSQSQKKRAIISSGYLTINYYHLVCGTTKNLVNIKFIVKSWWRIASDKYHMDGKISLVHVDLLSIFLLLLSVCQIIEK
jgi:insertion element IS1 protein InsB